MASYDLVIHGATLYDGSGGPPRRADLGGERRPHRGDRAGPGRRRRAGRRERARARAGLHRRPHPRRLRRGARARDGLQGAGASRPTSSGTAAWGAAPSARRRRLRGRLSPGDDAARLGRLRRLPRAPRRRARRACNVGGARRARHGARGGARRRRARAERRRARRHDARSCARASRPAASAFSSGLIYEPGKHAQTDELVGARVRGPRERRPLRDAHARRGRRPPRLGARGDRIGERAGVPVQISHHKAAGRESWGLVRESLALIDAARARGVDVTRRPVPLHRGEHGARRGRRRTSTTGGGHGVGRGDPEEVVLASAPKHPSWEGRSIAALAHGVGRRARSPPRSACSTPRARARRS